MAHPLGSLKEKKTYDGDGLRDRFASVECDRSHVLNLTGSGSLANAQH